eukprot:1150285-Pelagomonas_calceolata.AAC.3
MALLADLYSKLDDLAEELQVYPVDTIGDCRRISNVHHAYAQSWSIAQTPFWVHGNCQRE